jgi:type IV secretion system protein VirB9
VFRLLIKPPVVKPLPIAARPAMVVMDPMQPLIEPGPPPEQVVAERIDAAPQVVNSAYAIAEGVASADIVPTLIFDDGRFTYLRFPGNQEVPAVFHVLGDGSESVVNARMEGDLLVVDRVSRRLMLRAGSAVVGVWNEAFDRTGRPPDDGTTVPGVQRVVKAEAVTPAPTAGVSQ